MSKPDEAAAQTPGEQAGTSEPTFADRVNEVAGKMTLNDKGVWELPSDLEVPEEVKFAATIEKRRRDAQSSRAKLNHELQVTKAEAAALRDKVTGKLQLEISDELAEELQELKLSDPDAWRTRMNDLEAEAATKAQQELQELSSSASQVGEIERRKQVLADFQEMNPGLEITDEVLANDVPPRVSKKLENGEVTFEEFLGEVKEYLTRGKAIKRDEPGDDVADLGSVSGGHTADEGAIQGSVATSYVNDTY